MRMVPKIVFFLVLTSLVACSNEMDPKHDSGSEKTRPTRGNPEASGFFKLKAEDLNSCQFSVRPYSLMVKGSVVQSLKDLKVSVVDPRVETHLVLGDIEVVRDAYIDRVHHVNEDSDPIEWKVDQAKMILEINPQLNFPIQDQTSMAGADVGVVAIDLNKTSFFRIDAPTRATLPKENNFTAFGYHKYEKDSFMLSFQVFASCERPQDR